RDHDAFAQVLRGFHRTIESPDTTDRSAALRAVTAALHRGAKNIPQLRLPTDHWQAIGPGLEAVYRAGRKRMKRAFATDDDAAYHRWRIRAKSFFYQLGTLAPAWPARLCKTTARLKKLEGKIGDDHDLAVLKSVLREVPDVFGARCAIRRVITRMDRQSQKLRKASRKLGRSVYRQKPRRFIEQFEKHWRKWRKDGCASPLSKDAAKHSLDLREGTGSEG
ncbi:MAG: CHAD domain-containing protein, partial [Verrucomicrobiota bacterium]|nr:CHAD domain-containing protein [Verrucomicrobiota bacterium]